jgi:hypothetical protein
VFGRIIAPNWEIHNWTVSSKIFGTKRDKVTGVWRKLHSEELHDFYCSPHLIRVIELEMLTDDIRGWGGCGTYGEEQTCTAFTGKPEVKRPLGGVERVLLKRSLKKQDGKTGFFGSV